jgi:hypothetical protein
MAFCKDFQDTLDKFNVPTKEQQELFARSCKAPSPTLSASPRLAFEIKDSRTRRIVG